MTIFLFAGKRTWTPIFYYVGSILFLQSLKVHMASFPLGGSSRHVMSKGGPYGSSHERPEEPDPSGPGWYFSRKDIEENSPSRQDGIDLKKETYLRKSYCTLLQDLGMRLKV